MGIFRQLFKKKPVTSQPQPQLPLPDPKQPPRQTGGDPPWLRIARGELGVAEVPGSGDNPKILKYHSVTSLRSTNDSVAWCSAFCCWALEEAGVPSCKSAWAQSFLDWGTSLPEPRHGCIVVFRWSDGNHGHVAFYDETATKKHGGLQLLGGNQSDKVCIKDYESLKSRIVGLRWPKEYR